MPRAQRMSIRGKNRDAMEIEQLNMATDELTGDPIDNCILFVSDGKVKKLQLSDYMELNVKVNGGKITLLENTQKHKF